MANLIDIASKMYQSERKAEASFSADFMKGVESTLGAYLKESKIKTDAFIATIPADFNMAKVPKELQAKLKAYAITAKQEYADAAALASRLSPTNPRPWSQIAERAIEGDRIKTAELLKTSSPTYNKLSKRNQYIKINELAEDPDFILDLVDRNKQVGETFKEYIKALSLNEGKKAGTIGRSLNDIASKNPLDPSTIICSR